MSQFDRNGLISQSNFLFPDNTQQEITPSDIRQFDLDIIDSFALTGSLAVSASYAISASQAENANTATTASLALVAEQAIDVFIKVKNTSGGPINKGLAVHATGVTGENINVILADSSIPASMPAIGLLEETLNNNAVGRAIINGRLKNVDTTGLAAGANIFVNGAGTLTVNKPTGSDEIQSIGVAGKISSDEGEIIIQGAGRVNALPNIQDGYLWVGDANGVPQAVATSSIVTDVDTGSLATTGSNDFFGDQTITSTTSAALTITSGVGDSSPITIEGGSNPAEGKFTNSSIKGVVDLEATNLISTALTTSSLHIGEDEGISNTVSIINKFNTGDDNIALGFSTSNTVNAYIPFDAGTLGTTNLRGSTINLLGSGSTTSVNVDGDVTASVFTGSFVGDGTGLTLDLPSGLLSSSVTDFNTYSASVDTRLQTAEGEIDSLQAVTGSYATTGSNTFIGNQTTTGSLFVSGNLEIANTEGIGAGPIILGPEQSIIPEQLNIERRLHVTQSSQNDLGAIVLKYPYTGSGGSEGEITQRFYTTGSQTRYEQRLSGVDGGEFVAVNTDLQFKTEGGGGVQFIVPAGGINFQSLGGQTSNQLIQKTTTAISGTGQKDSIQISSYTGANGVTYNTNVWGIQNYPGGYNNAFTIGKYNSAFTYVSECFVSEGAVKSTIAKGNYDYDFILIQDNGNGTTSAVIKADQIQLGGSPNNQIIAPAPVTLQQALTLGQQDPLPAGGVGQLAVSSSADLYYHNGTAWSKIN